VIVADDAPAAPSSPAPGQSPNGSVRLVTARLLDVSHRFPVWSIDFIEFSSG
jgi:hypothetical protein